MPCYRLQKKIFITGLLIAVTVPHKYEKCHIDACIDMLPLQRKIRWEHVNACRKGRLRLVGQGAILGLLKSAHVTIYKGRLRLVGQGANNTRAFTTCPPYYLSLNPSILGLTDR